ncbi:hypothetical protein ACP3TJ_08445 [Desulforudis sp. 1088]|uniref:hypothetical protein n=1 Tax=unclassified Candidatus Desulforudis TaxID=2635950 RepID=UPI0034783439
MQWYGLKIKIVILTFIFGLAVFLGGNFLYDKYGSNQSLRQDLSANEYVESFELEDQGAFVLVTVRMRPNDNLMREYRALERGIETGLNGRPYRLVIEDTRDKALSDVLYESQYAIHQAIAQGSFPEMARVIEENARGAGAAARVFVDNKYVYVQLEGRNGSFLLEVIPRGAVNSDDKGLNGGGLYA